MSIKDKFSNHPLFAKGIPATKPVIEDVVVKKEAVLMKQSKDYVLPDSIANYVKAHKCIVERTPYLFDKLSETDKLIIDLEHYIELESSPSIVMKLAFKLKAALLLRRDLKDELHFLDSVVNTMAIDRNTAKLGKLVSKRVNTMNSRSYTPRVKTLKEIINE